MESVEMYDDTGIITTSDEITPSNTNCDVMLHVEENSHSNSDTIIQTQCNSSDETVFTKTDTPSSTSTAQNNVTEFRTLQPKVYVPPIEETIDLENHKDYLDRFFTQRYCINMNQKFNDHCVLIHSNKVCVITLAPSHPLICSDIKIEKIDFQVSKNVNRLNNTVSGKHKRKAQNLNQTSPLCFVECANGEVFTIYSVVPGKLLEMNEELESNPEKIRECCPTFYYKQCYVAMVLPNIRHTVETLNKDLLTPEEYQEEIKKREECKNDE